MDWNQFWDKVWSVIFTGGTMLLKVIGLLILGYIVIRIIKSVVKKLLKKSPLDELMKKYIFKALSVLLYFFLILAVIQTMGIDVTGVIAALAAVGLAVALALQSALTSLANGIILLITKPFKENDSVVINGISGKVVSISFFNTIIDTWDNRRIIIPNKNMIDYEIENTDYHGTRRMAFTFTVSHNTDIDKLREIVVNAFVSNKNVFTDRMPELNFKEIGQGGIKVEARAWTLSDSFSSVQGECMQTIYNELKKHGIELATNAIVVYNEQRNQNLFYKNEELPERDINVNPIARKSDLTFEDYLDDITAKRKEDIKKSFRKRKKDKNKNKKSQHETETATENNSTENN